MARQVLPFVGAGIGFFIGGPTGAQIGFAIGSLVGNEVDPLKVYGPKLGDAKIQSVRDGIPIPWGFGVFRVAGNVIACQPGPPTEVEVESREGKGSGPINVNYQYTRTHAVLICEGPILGVRRVWRDNKLVFDAGAAPVQAPGQSDSSFADLVRSWIAARAAATSFSTNTRLYLGDETQLPDSELEAIFGAGNVPAHRGIAYMVFVDDDVTERRGSLSQYEFEVVTAGTLEAFPTVGGNSQWSPPLSADNIDFADNFATASVSPPQVKSSSNARSTAGRSAGKLYFEMYSGVVGSGCSAGLVTGDQDMTFDATPSISHYGKAWGLSTNGVALSTEGDPPGFHLVATMSPSVVGVICDLDAGKVWYQRDGVSEGDPVAGTGALFTTLGAGPFYPAAWLLTPSTATLRLRADEFTLTVPTGYSAWGSAAGVPLPDAPVFGVDDQGNIIYDGAGSVPDSVLPSTFTVKTVLDAIAVRTGAELDMYDFSEMATDAIQGLVIAREAQGDGVMATLSQSFFFDIVEVDGVVTSIKRGKNSIITIDINDVLEREGAPVSETREQEIERPAKLNFIYQDPLMSYIPTKQTSSRYSATVAAIGERSIDSPVVMGRDQAAQIAEVAIKVIWNDLDGTVSLELPSSFSFLVPSDIIILSYKGRNRRLRIENVNLDSGKLEISERYDRQSSYTSTVEGVGDPPLPPPSGLFGITQAEFINIRPLSDADDKFGFYVALRGLLPNWPGARVDYSIDGGLTWIIGPTISTASIIGQAVTVLPYAVAEYADTHNTVRVSIPTGELSSITELQWLQEGNACILGDEVMNFQDATLVSEGIYDLSIIARGRLGSVPVDHSIAERFVMLAGAVFIETATSLVNQQIKIRAVTLGTLPANNPVYDESMLPSYIQTEHKAAYLRLYRGTDNSILLNWSGRGRMGTARNAFQGTYFSQYVIDFDDGLGTVIRKTAPAQSMVYSAADQTIDFGAPPASLTVTLYQRNSITGLGAGLTGIV